MNNLTKVEFDFDKVFESHQNIVIQFIEETWKLKILSINGKYNTKITPKYFGFVGRIEHLKKLVFFIFCESVRISDDYLYLGDWIEYTSTDSYTDYDDEIYRPHPTIDWTKSEFLSKNFIQQSDFVYEKFDSCGIDLNNTILSISEFVVFSKEIKSNSLFVRGLFSRGQSSNSIEVIKYSKLEENQSFIQSLKDFISNNPFNRLTENEYDSLKIFISENKLYNKILIFFEIIKVHFGGIHIFEFEFEFEKLLKTFKVLQKIEELTLFKLFDEHYEEYLREKNLITTHPFFNRKDNRYCVVEDIVEDSMRKDILNNIDFLRNFVSFFEKGELMKYSSSRYNIFFNLTMMTSYHQLITFFKLSWDKSNIRVNISYPYMMEYGGFDKPFTQLEEELIISESTGWKEMERFIERIKEKISIVSQKINSDE